MFVDFLYELRKRGLKVGPQEGLTLAAALTRDLHDTTLDGFYDVARSLLVHREQDLDTFDQAFASYFQGIETEALQISEELLSWLKEAAPRRELTDEQRKLLETLDLDEVRKRFAERLRNQKSRHDGGNRHIGTGGTSPFGKGGTHPSGISVGDGPASGQGALARAGARGSRALRGDLTLDVRQLEVALRRLRGFVREGAHLELDLDGTIAKTASNGGDLEIVLHPERRPSVRVLLLLDVGGSMDPHVDATERLFSAAQRAKHWKQLQTYYFHNCVYAHVYKSALLRDPVPVTDVLAECDASWKLILVGDALMHPSELFQSGSAWTHGAYEEWSDVPGVAWLDQLARHFRRTAWLNPEPERLWRGTAEIIARLFPMHRLSLDGLTAAVHQLARR